MLVTSNQSAPILVVLLDQGAASVILTETIGVVSTKTSVTFNTKITEESGVFPIVVSSTLMVTL